MKKRVFWNKKKKVVFSGLFTNLPAGWFGVVFIIPGITHLASLNDWLWLTKNLLFGIVALNIAPKLGE